MVLEAEVSTPGSGLTRRTSTMALAVLPDQTQSIAQSFHVETTDAIALLVFT